jgi:hypothetical protein
VSRRLPPLSALCAFAIAARTSSFVALTTSRLAKTMITELSQSQDSEQSALCYRVALRGPHLWKVFRDGLSQAPLAENLGGHINDKIF